MDTTAQSDFVDIQLSAAGIAMVGANGALQITNAHLSYKFTPGVSTRVLTSEWSKMLSRESYQGKSIFELAPVVSAASKTTTTIDDASQATTVATKGKK